jgi:pSer/pThr/pTyr-binding forkhead associated (FHA) protein
VGAAGRAIPLADQAIEPGRDNPTLAAHSDPRISRRHARVRYDGRRFVVTDLGSRDGTAVDGEALASGA